LAGLRKVAAGDDDHRQADQQENDPGTHGRGPWPRGRRGERVKKTEDQTDEDGDSENYLARLPTPRVGSVFVHGFLV
jgi:hypothetical protein